MVPVSHTFIGISSTPVVEITLLSLGIKLLRELACARSSCGEVACVVTFCRDELLVRRGCLPRSLPHLLADRLRRERNRVRLLEDTELRQLLPQRISQTPHGNRDVVRIACVVTWESPTAVARW